MYRQSEKMLNINTSSTRSHNMVNFGPLPAEIGLPVWGTPANFNGFRALPSLLQRRRSREANQTLHDVWSYSGLVLIHFRGLLLPWRNFATCKIHFASKSCVLLHWQCYCTALQKRASARLRRSTRNGITELPQRAPPIFGWAAITLGIGPHSSCKRFAAGEMASRVTQGRC